MCNPTNLATKMVKNNWPVIPSKFVSIIAKLLTGVISPYPTVVNVVKLKYINSQMASNLIEKESGFIS